MKPSSTRVNWPFLVQTAGTFLVSSYLVLIAGNTRGMLNINILILDAVLLLAAALLLTLRPRRFQLPLRWPILAWVLVFIVTMVFSIDPRRSLSQFEVMLIGVLIFTLGAYLARDGWRLNWVIAGILLSGALLMLLGWLEYGLWYRAWLAANPGIFIPVIQFRPTSANIIAFNLNIILLLAVFTLFRRKRSLLPTILLAVYILSALGLLYITSSRGGWLGTVSGLGIFTLGWLWVHPRRVASLWRAIRARPFILAALITVIAAAVLAFIWLLIAQSRHPTHGSFFSSRAAFWGPAWQEFLKDPLTGTGPFTYASTFMRYNSVPNTVLYSHSHGTPVNILSEMGLLGMVAGLFLVISPIFLFIKHLNAGTSKDQRKLAQLGLALLAAVLIHGIFDCFHLEPGGLWILLFTISFILSISSSKNSNSQLFQKIAFIPFLLLLIGIYTRIPYENGVSAGNLNNWNEAVTNFQTAVNRDPLASINHQQLGLAYSQLAFEDNDFFEKSIMSFSKAIELDPNWSLNYANLGQIFSITGDKSKAIALLFSALNKSPSAAMYAKEIGILCEDNSDFDCALFSYIKYLKNHSYRYDEIFWNTNSFRKSVLNYYITINQYNKAKSFYISPYRKFITNDQIQRAYINYIQYLLSKNEIASAQEYYSIAVFAHKASIVDTLDLAKISDQYFESTDNYTIADEKKSFGLYGLGTFGVNYYGPRQFRKNTLAIEMLFFD